jgi:hypothetical protein
MMNFLMRWENSPRSSRTTVAPDTRLMPLKLLLLSAGSTPPGERVRRNGEWPKRLGEGDVVDAAGDEVISDDA